MLQGLLDGLSTLPTSTWADGDPVFLGATAGSITNVKPYAPNHLVYSLESQSTESRELMSIAFKLHLLTCSRY